MDYRVHVVRDEVFAFRIVSDADDYRHAHRQGPGPNLAFEYYERVTEQPIGEAVARLLVGNTAGATDRVALRACGVRTGRERGAGGAAAAPGV